MTTRRPPTRKTAERTVERKRQRPAEPRREPEYADVLNEALRDYTKAETAVFETYGTDLDPLVVVTIATSILERQSAIELRDAIAAIEGLPMTLR